MEYTVKSIKRLNTISELVDSKDIDKKKLAKSLGISRVYLYKLIHTNKFTMEQAEAIVNYLGYNMYIELVSKQCA